MSVFCDERLSARWIGKERKGFCSSKWTSHNLCSGELSIKTSHEKKMDVAEMKMPRWACGHTLID